MTGFGGKRLIGLAPYLRDLAVGPNTWKSVSMYSFEVASPGIDEVTGTSGDSFKTNVGGPRPMGLFYSSPSTSASP